MDTTLKNTRFQDLVNNPLIFSMGKRIITENYIEAAPGHETEMRGLMEDVFDRLQASSKAPRPVFEAMINALPEQVFHQSEPDFWFNRIYRGYKRTIKPQRRFENLRPWIAGERILDFGCGDGRLSMVFKQNGYQVFLADVLDYRDPLAVAYPFVQMSQSWKIPYPDYIADTALVMAVLHHVEDADLTPILSELKRLATRVIVEEDSYGIPANFPGLAEVLTRDRYLREFQQLSSDDQFRYLMFIDYFANAITQGLPQMDFPFNFRTVPEWIKVFQEHGFQVSDVAIMGFQKGFFNRSCHVWFVLDV